MNDIPLINKLNLNKKEVISFIGAGGKTTTIAKLATELRDTGNRVLSTTSTAIFLPKREHYDRIYIRDISIGYIPNTNSITIYGEYEENKKLRVKDISKIDELIKREIFDYVLIEADGSKGKPIKGAAEHEPVVSDLTTITVGVIGLDSLDRNINDAAHRPEILIKIIEAEDNHIIDYKDIIKLTLHKEGIFKNSKGRRILFLNKIEDRQLEVIEKIKDGLKNTDIEVVVGEKLTANSIKELTMDS